MPFIVQDGQTGADATTMADYAFSPDHRALWKKVSRPGPVAGRIWDNERLAAFQEAVEKRATWLYRCFHDDLGYAGWISEQSQNGGFQ